jgi:hypothetical protein
MLSFDDHLINKIDKPRKHWDSLKPAEKMIWDKYRGKQKEYQAHIEDFEDVYGEKETKRDVYWVEEMKKREDPGSERGELMELIMILQAETANWFGENSFLFSVSEYDDRKAHGDIVLEIMNDNGEPVRILLDITVSGEENNLIDKMQRSFDILRRERRLSTIKYFQSEATGEKERLINIPRVTIGITPDTLGELCVDLNKNFKKQENNPIQLYLLDQIENQLIHLLEAAKEMDVIDPVIIKNLENAEKEIKKVLNKKENLRTKNFDAKANEDLAYRTLTR